VIELVRRDKAGVESGDIILLLMRFEGIGSRSSKTQPPAPTRNIFFVLGTSNIHGCLLRSCFYAICQRHSGRLAFEADRLQVACHSCLPQETNIRHKVGEENSVRVGAGPETICEFVG
jgi:hypothetical protein